MGLPHEESPKLLEKEHKATPLLLLDPLQVNFCCVVLLSLISSFIVRILALIQKEQKQKVLSATEYDIFLTSQGRLIYSHLIMLQHLGSCRLLCVSLPVQLVLYYLEKTRSLILCHTLKGC